MLWLWTTKRIIVCAESTRSGILSLNGSVSNCCLTLDLNLASAACASYIRGVSQACQNGEQRLRPFSKSEWHWARHKLTRLVKVHLRMPQIDTKRPNQASPLEIDQALGASHSASSNTCTAHGHPEAGSLQHASACLPLWPYRRPYCTCKLFTNAPHQAGMQGQRKGSLHSDILNYTELFQNLL